MSFHTLSCDIEDQVLNWKYLIDYLVLQTNIKQEWLFMKL